MAIGIRYFLIREDGALDRVPIRTVTALVHHQERWRHCANKSVRVISALYDLKDSKPSRIFQMEGAIWHFDKLGRLQSRLEGWMIESLAEEPSAGTVVDISAMLQQKRWHRENKWEIPAAIADEVAELVLKKPKAKKVIHPAAFRINKPRWRPTMAAQRTIEECLEAFAKINWALNRLPYTDRCDVERKAKQFAKKEGDALAGELWKLVSKHCDSRTKAEEAWHKGGGKWFAVARLSRWTDPFRNEGHDEDLEEILCDTKDEAVAKVREMAVKHADKNGDLVSVLTEIYPENWNHE